MLPRSRACGAGEGLALVRGQVEFVPPPPAPDATRWTRPHQQAEGVLDFLKHIGVLGLAGRLSPQCQKALCGQGGRQGDRGHRDSVRERGSPRELVMGSPMGRGCEGRP